jgi:hypothetical protein
VRLIDRIIQCRTPFIVENCVNHCHTRLSGAMLKSRTVEWRFDAGKAQRSERSSRGSTP